MTVPQFRQILREELERHAAASPSRVLTIEELSRVTGLTRSIIYRKNMRGEIPGAYKQGKRTYYDRQVVEAWLLSEPLKPAA